MQNLLRDARHLVRLGGLFVLGFVAFLLLRGIFIPSGFGDYGFYRRGALDDNRVQELRFAGRAACAECHDDIVAERAGSLHARIGCESCHGPLAAHAADPGDSAPPIPSGDDACLVCHLDTAARPPAFPQITPLEHAGDSPCLDCHSPHHPEL